MPNDLPPKIKPPNGPMFSFSLIVLPIILVTILLQCQPFGQMASTSNSREREEFTRILNLPRDALSHDGSVEEVSNDAFLTLNHDGVRIKTQFQPSWKVASDGRQKILTSVDGSIVCQSLVIPRKEFDEMVSSTGGLREAVEGAARLGIEQGLPTNAAVSISSKQLFREGGPNPHQGYRLSVTVSASGRQFRQSPIYIWTTSTSHAASLTCFSMNNSNEAMPQSSNFFRIE